jgi:redox-sensitive bicupin YhaK (pirin superfamily)
MDDLRKVSRKVVAVETFEGAGARVKRVFPTSQLRHFDPFVLLDEFFAEPPAGFPSHPHR